MLLLFMYNETIQEQERTVARKANYGKYLNNSGF